MRIRRIEIRNFRRFTAPLLIDRISDGLTVLSGDNEEGKSTILRALRAALFDRHGVSKDVARELVPFQSEVQPEVALDFELPGGRYRLRKGFYQKQFARLELPTGARLEGPAAEQALQELLSFESPARGLSKVADHGIFGLLWLEQGASFANWNAAMKDRKEGPAQRSLLSALESEVGEVLGGARGREILETISRRYSEYYDKNRKPRGEFAKCLDRERVVSEELSSVDAALRGYQAQIDELSLLRERLARYEREGDLLRAQRERQAAEGEARRIEALTQTQREAEQGKKIADVQLQAAAVRSRQRDEDRRRLAERSALVQEQRSALDAAQIDLQPQHDALQEAQAALAAALRRQQQADEALRRCQQAEHSLRLAQQLAALNKQYQQAQSAHEQALICRAKADAIAIDDKRLRLMHKLDRERAEAEAGLQAVATRLSFALRDDVCLQLQGQRLAAGQPLHMTEPTQLELMQGDQVLGVLTITPGADDLNERRKHVEAARHKLQRELDAAGVADIAAAELRASERADLLMQAQQHEKLRLVHAPEGIEALRVARLRVEEECKALRAEGAASAEAANLPFPEANATDSAAREQLAQQLTAARQASEQALREVKQTQAQSERQQQTWQAAQEQLTRLRIELESNQRELRLAEEALQQARLRESDDVLQQALARSQEERRAAELAAQAAHQALQQARPDEVNERLSSRQRAVELIQRDIDDKRQRMIRLEGELQALGQQGLGERREELQAERERARALSTRMAKEAEALRLLLDTLQVAEREAKETFLAPVQSRIQPYLSQVFPGCSLRFSDGDLAISHLRRGELDEPFEALSIGTREQLAILTRLAFADLLREQGQPTCLVLDDALVYADDGRFERMLRVLQRAAKQQQILILTCRERDYQMKGIETRRLSDCVQRSAA